ncbi:MAG: T9SS type A sorting domain-containing protein [Cyclobacteriaceae bacterium]
MISRLFIFLFVYSVSEVALAQVTLQADGPDNTYELINSILAPGFDVVEVPDCNHTDFGRHIDEVMDTDLNKYVFRFHIHTSPDNDRCQKEDRQRNEIKTYDKSPDNLLGHQYESAVYKWKFKLDEAFQPSSSFTHLHQIKAVDGPEDSMPLITITARKGSPDQLELRYADKLTQSTLKKTDLTPFKGIWVEATETIYYDEVGLGSYDLELKSVSGGDLLFSYSDNAIRTWKTDASFLRPKWGIYRSLNDAGSLRDEQVLFADISIEEIKPILSLPNVTLADKDLFVYPNPANHQLRLSEGIVTNYERINMYDHIGKLVLSESIVSDKISISNLPTGMYYVQFMVNGLRGSSIKTLIE